MEMTLRLPQNYVEIEEEEMMYIDGGGVGRHWWNKTSNVAHAINIISWFSDKCAILFYGWKCRILDCNRIELC